MLTEKDYVVSSLELHLFFGRIMKEHSLFLQAGFTPKNGAFGEVANRYLKQFESVLQNAARLGAGVVGEAAAVSGEFVTDHTLGAEQKTQAFTGIEIDSRITRLEDGLWGTPSPNVTPALTQHVKALNMGAAQLLDGLIRFKTAVLNDVLSCRMFTMNYPLLIEHIIREAKLYRSQIAALEKGRGIDENIRETELFWDQIMMEHAQFIRGLLDPAEDALIQTADDFSKKYAQILKEARGATERSIDAVTRSTLVETKKYRDFKEAGTEGIAACKIRSVILPLLADHVLREANHFLRLLGQYAK